MNFWLTLDTDIHVQYVARASIKQYMACYLIGLLIRSRAHWT